MKNFGLITHLANKKWQQISNHCLILIIRGFDIKLIKTNLQQMIEDIRKFNIHIMSNKLYNQHIPPRK